MGNLHILLLIFFFAFTPILAIRFLFAIDLSCDNDEVFEFNVSHWEADMNCMKGSECKQDDVISPERYLTARKHLFFYQEGSATNDNSNGLRRGNALQPFVLIEHTCTKNGSIATYRECFRNIDSDKVIQRINITVNLSNPIKDPSDSIGIRDDSKTPYSCRTHF